MGCTNSKNLPPVEEPEKKEEKREPEKPKLEPKESEAERLAREAEEERKRQAEEQRLKEEAERKAELNEKFTALCTEFVDLLSTQILEDGEKVITLEDLKTVYNNKAGALIAMADENADGQLNVEECKKLFMVDGEPDCELVMKAIEGIALVKDIRARKKAKKAAEKRRLAFEDACGEYVDAMNSKLDGKMTDEELRLVYNKPFEKYASVLYDFDVLTTEGVINAFSEGDDEYETTLVVELTEAFGDIKTMRESEAEFDEQLDRFFDGKDSLDVTDLKQYFKEDAQKVFSDLDKNDDGAIDKSEMKSMFRLETGYYDAERLGKVKAGLGDAMKAQHEAELKKAKENFLQEVGQFKALLGKAISPITVEELEIVMPETAADYIELCNVEATEESFLEKFPKGESYDKAALILLKEAVQSVLDKRLKDFEEKLTEFSGMMVASWLKKLKLDELKAECPDAADSYEKICTGKREDLNEEVFKGMFVVDGVPQFKAFSVVYDKLKTIQNKALAKFDRRMNDLVDFIGTYCNKEDMGTFKRQDVFQVYIDETRVGEFDKRWVKKMLNKPIADLPSKQELRDLFTNKKTKEPDPKLVKGFLAALKTITDRRRLSIKQASLLLDAEYEENLQTLIKTLADNTEDKAQGIEVLNSMTPDYSQELISTLVTQLEAAHNARLKLEEIKPLFMKDSKQDMLGLSDFTNAMIEAIKRVTKKEVDDEEQPKVQEEEEVQAADDDAKRGPGMVERPADVNIFKAEDNAEAAEKRSDAIAEQTDQQVVEEAAKVDAIGEEAVDVKDVKIEETEVQAAVEESEPAKRGIVKSAEPEPAKVDEAKRQPDPVKLEEIVIPDVPEEGIDDEEDTFGENMAPAKEVEAVKEEVAVADEPEPAKEEVHTDHDDDEDTFGENMAPAKEVKPVEAKEEVVEQPAEQEVIQEEEVEAKVELDNKEPEEPKKEVADEPEPIANDVNAEIEENEDPEPVQAKEEVIVAPVVDQVEEPKEQAIEEEVEAKAESIQEKVVADEPEPIMKNDGIEPVVLEEPKEQEVQEEKVEEPKKEVVADEPEPIAKEAEIEDPQPANSAKEEPEPIVQDAEIGSNEDPEPAKEEVIEAAVVEKVEEPKEQDIEEEVEAKVEVENKEEPEEPKKEEVVDEPEPIAKEDPEPVKEEIEPVVVEQVEEPEVQEEKVEAKNDESEPIVKDAEIEVNEDPEPAKEEVIEAAVVEEPKEQAIEEEVEAKIEIENKEAPEEPKKEVVEEPEPAKEEIEPANTIEKK